MTIGAWAESVAAGDGTWLGDPLTVWEMNDGFCVR